MAFIDPKNTGKATPSNPVAPGIGGPSPGVRDNPGTESYPNQTATSGSNATPNPQAPTTPQIGGTDWTSDPIYQLAVGQTNLAIKQAQSAALTAETQALIAYGDASLALAVTGDQNVANAAAANKASTLAQLMATNKENVRNTNETENQSNLFYSSDRGRQLGLDQQMYLNNSANALSGVQGTLGGISANLLAQQQAAYQNETQAASEAYARALANPIGSPAGSGTPPPPAGSSPKLPPSPWSGSSGGTAYKTITPTKPLSGGSAVNTIHFGGA